MTDVGTAFLSIRAQGLDTIETDVETAGTKAGEQGGRAAGESFASQLRTVLHDQQGRIISETTDAFAAATTSISTDITSTIPAAFEAVTTSVEASAASIGDSFGAAFTDAAGAIDSASGSLDAFGSAAADASGTASDALAGVGDVGVAAGAKAGHGLGTGIAAGAAEAEGALGKLKESAKGFAEIFAVGEIIKGLGELTTEALNAAASERVIDNAIKQTGHEATLSGAAIETLTDKLSVTDGVSKSLLLDADKTLSGFKNLGDQGIFDQALKSSTDLAAQFKIQIPAAAKLLGKALDAPAQGLAGLARVGLRFTDAQKAQITALEATGVAADHLQAQQIILTAVQERTGGAAAAAATPFGKLAAAFNLAGEQVVKALLPAAGQLATVLGRLLVTVTPIIGKLLDFTAATLKFVTTNKDFITGVEIAAALLGPLAITLGAVALATKAWAVAEGIATFATQTLALAAFNLDAALDANPIGAVIVAIAGLVTALVLAYEKSETFRDVVNASFNAVTHFVGDAVGAVVQSLKALFDGFTGVLRGLLDGVSKVSGALSHIPGAGSIFGPIKQGANEVNDAFGTVDSTLTSLANSAYGFGTDIGGGLSSGAAPGLNNLNDDLQQIITNGATALSAVQAQAQSAIADLVKSTDLIQQNGLIGFNPGGTKVDTEIDKAKATNLDPLALTDAATKLPSVTSGGGGGGSSAAAAAVQDPAVTTALAALKGQAITAALVKGITGGKSAVDKALATIDGEIDKALNKPSQAGARDQVLELLKARQKGLESLADAQVAVTAKIKDATDQVTSLGQAADSLTSSVFSSIKGAAALSGAFNGLTLGQGVTAPASLFTNFLAKQVTASSTFAADLASLKSKGLSQDLLSQIAGDSTNGAAEASSLSAASDSQIAALNASQASISANAQSASQTAAYDTLDQITKVNAQLVALNSKQDTLIKQGQTAASEIGTAAGTAVGTALNKTAATAKQAAKTRTASHSKGTGK